MTHGAEGTFVEHEAIYRTIAHASRIKHGTKWPTIPIACRESCAPLSSGHPGLLGESNLA